MMLNTNSKDRPSCQPWRTAESIEISQYLLTLGLAFLLARVWLDDARNFTVPTVATAAIAAISALKVLSVNLPSFLFPHILSASILTFLLWLASEIYWRRRQREALGLGDVKLIGALTIWFGPVEIWSVLLVASIGAIAFGLMRLAKGQAGMHIPFGPFLSFAAVLQALLDLWSGS
ncbi:prepilin peptidase [Stagnihabitans tardus]|uniref:Prepilin type IV endopeptidase peptidase domain-containing protein n=1 Tax=Stagnihabitans tardus TaxID=2699202 RepID=A0AAE5BWJ5_9RHOB|nr:A24 family peptidase [Stagnihabitans tardus]NBZ90081.1 hypothetical protein [Stagnihabitans tardus]